ncbi:MAG: cyclase [Nitrospiraceae bacterium]
MEVSITGRERYRTHTQDLGWTEEQVEENVGDIERLVSGFVGGALLIAGLMRPSRARSALALTGAALLHRGVTGFCPLYHAAGINTADTNALGRRKVRTSQAIKVEKRIRIDRSPEELYRFWRNSENLPRIMSHLESVQVINDRLSHWVVKTLPGAPSVEWDAEIINEVPNELIGWRSLNGADVENAGSVRFERTPDGHGTNLTVMLQYRPPAGRLGAAIANLFGEDAERKIEEDLQRFKETMESEVQRIR